MDKTHLYDLGFAFRKGSRDTVLLDGCPGFFEHPLPYASGSRYLL